MHCYPSELPEELIRKTVVNKKSVFSAIEKALGVTADQLIGQSRKREIAEGRHIACWCLSEMGKFRLAVIGRVMGNRDHTTVINSKRQFRNFMETDPVFRSKYESVRSYL